MEKEKKNTNGNALALTPENKKRLIIFVAVAAVLYFILPLVLNRMTETIRANGLLLLFMLLDQVFIGVVGWQANYFPSKYSIYVPIAFIVLFAVSEVLIFGQVGWGLELNFLQTGYICYFLKKLLSRRQAMDQKNQQKPFPKGVTRKK